MASLSEPRASVASELEAIFAPLPRLTPATAAETPAPKRASARRTRPILWIMLLAAVVVAALIGSLLVLRPTVAPPPAARPVMQTQAATRSAPSPAIIVKPPVPTTAPPPALTQIAPARRGAVQSARESVSTPRRAARPAPQRTRHERCPRFASEAWCLHGTIMAADDQLRDAYDAAMRAGVDRAVLVDVRADWKRLRSRANSDPQTLIRGYASLTQQLRAQMREVGP